MALFNKEPDKGPRVQPVQPANVPNSQPPPAATSQPVAAPAPKPTPAPAEGRTYLDRGTKISGKLSFEGPARVDGEVDGEISAKDALTIGESAIVTAQVRATSIIVCGKI